MKKVILALIPTIAVVFTTGFARAPFAHWMTGRVVRVEAAEKSLSLDSDSKGIVALKWNDRTRFWPSDAAKRDRGTAFGPASVEPNQRVEVMFKERSGQKIAARIIQAPSHATVH